MRSRALLLLSLSLLACGGDEDSGRLENGYWFVGRVYDGVTGEPLDRYEIALRFLDQEVEGNVDGEGRYRVGPLQAHHDFTIEIAAAGYRSFASHNAGRSDGVAFGETAPREPRSFYFDAVVFPSSVKAPPVHLDVAAARSTERPTGRVRLTPTSSSFIADGLIPAGVSNQMWVNDADLQQGAIGRDVADGAVDIEEGALVYGVTYRVLAYGTPGHGTAQGLLTAGLDARMSLVLPELDDREALQLVYSSAREGRPAASADLVLVFNREVELDALLDPDRMAEAVDDGFAIASPDRDDDGETNRLPGDDDETVRERGTQMTLAGSSITFHWDGTLETSDGDDPVQSTTWGNMGQVYLRPVGGDGSTQRRLSDFVGSSVGIPLAH